MYYYVELECVAKPRMVLILIIDILIYLTVMHQLNFKLNLKGHNIDLSRISSLFQTILSSLA